MKFGTDGLTCSPRHRTETLPSSNLWAAIRIFRKKNPTDITQLESETS